MKKNTMAAIASVLLVFLLYPSQYSAGALGSTAGAGNPETNLLDLDGSNDHALIMEDLESERENGPFSYWDLPSPPGSEGYRPNQILNSDLERKGLSNWGPTVDPESTIIPGEMRSDSEMVPEGFTKEDADRAEIAESQYRETGAFALRAATGCGVYWPSWYEVCGAIKTKYDEMGGPQSFLSLPKSGELTNPDGIGKRSEFLNGFIYWHPDTGAQSVSIPVSAVWQRHGWEQGFLGYPISSDIMLGNQWFKQIFQGGYVYTHNAVPPTQASVQGAIYVKWQSLGGENGELGFPISDELTSSDGIGRYSIFERGIIYWTPEGGAHSITGEMLAAWASDGFEEGLLGYPINDSVFSARELRQEFENGSLIIDLSDPLRLLVSYMQFNSSVEAEDFFDSLEAITVGLEGNDRASRQSALHVPEIGPCELEAQHPHPRKSSNYNAVGFKPVTRCSEDVPSVIHTSTLYYYYYGVGKPAPQATEIANRPEKGIHLSAKERSRGFRVQYTSKDLAQICEGSVKTTFQGRTLGEIITYSGKTYYARVNSHKIELNCEVPDGRPW